MNKTIYEAEYPISLDRLIYLSCLCTQLVGVLDESLHALRAIFKLLRLFTFCDSLGFIGLDSNNLEYHFFFGLFQTLHQSVCFTPCHPLVIIVDEGANVAGGCSSHSHCQVVSVLAMLKMKLIFGFPHPHQR